MYFLKLILKNYFDLYIIKIYFKIKIYIRKRLKNTKDLINFVLKIFYLFTDY